MHRNTTYTKTTFIQPDIYEEAQRRSNLQPVLDRSERKEEGNQVGCLGEVIAEAWMDSHNILYTPELGETTHDYRLGNSLTIDVKTKDRTVKPLHNYDNSAPLYNHAHQKPTLFLFISLERNRDDHSNDIKRYHTANIVGSIFYDELDRVGITFLEGEKDWRNPGKPFFTDVLNIEMWQLIPLNETIEIFKGLRKRPSQDVTLNFKIINEMKKRIDNGELRYRKLPI